MDERGAVDGGGSKESHREGVDERRAARARAG